MTEQSLRSRELPTSQFRTSDIARAAWGGLRANTTRAVLSALGIAIGIASMVSVLGIASSSQAELIAKLDRLGTNLLTVTPGSSFLGDTVDLPKESIGMVGRIGPVSQVSSVTEADQSVYRSDQIPVSRTGGLSTYAADPDLLDVLEGSLLVGQFLDERPSGLPVVVLGHTAASRLGVQRTGVQVLIGDEWFGVVGILAPLELVPQLDAGVFIPRQIAESVFDVDPEPTALYVRSDLGSVEAVESVLAETANPDSPEAVSISRPSDALEAREATEQTFTTLLVGLGGVALIVGALGIANVMVIAVLERRSEIGLRRALGATQPHIARQFLGEAVLLSGIGGAGGGVLGILVVVGYATSRTLPIAIDAWVPIAGFLTAVVIGAIAGVYPASRAARMSPTEALNA